MTSTQAVGFIKRVLNAQKVGHGGTLDPLAHGVLPIALGEATKTVPFIMDAHKEYEFTVQWGAATETDDLEGEVTNTSDKRPTTAEIEDILEKFTGEITQTPPIYSAVKINGQAAYKRVRRGEDVEIKPRLTTIYDLKLVAESDGTATFLAEAGKGTYVRSLARDMGEMLGCYGHVIDLKRARVGSFKVLDGITKEMLDEASESGHDPLTFVQDVGVVLDDIPVYKASFAEKRSIHLGEQITRIHLEPGVRKMIAPDGELVSIVEIEECGSVKVVRNFNVGSDS